MAYLICDECDWEGYDTELVALKDSEERDADEFIHCPACLGMSFDEEDEED